MSEQSVEVPTDQGPGRLSWVVGDDPKGVLLLGGGHSGQVRTVDLDALARALPAHGWVVARFEFGWRVAGKKVGPRPPASDPAWEAAVAEVGRRWPGLPLVTGGRSAGARIACRTWTPDLAGVLALSFPLHPPGKPEASRAAEMEPVGVPMLLVSGARDPFGSPAEFADALARTQGGPRNLIVVPGATHSFPAAASGKVVAAAEEFLTPLLG
ncbi:hydrolase [Propioniciclava coleopterorum]|uniref:Hydrolase n=1 Tax=Propioniciclava coleopterorum TaxID=2714937 RepID=A0A6G7Y2T8_9ACTN|nr:alpha/beta family hydrolase [Propioniciclava coleopterorum]QIK71122.1 hydrolase [Propioniciclava coleopterorum]